MIIIAAIILVLIATVVLLAANHVKDVTCERDSSERNYQEQREMWADDLRDAKIELRKLKESYLYSQELSQEGFRDIADTADEVELDPYDKLLRVYDLAKENYERIAGTPFDS